MTSFVLALAPLAMPLAAHGQTAPPASLRIDVPVVMLSDAAYDRVRKSTGGNPYRDLIARLQKAGVRFEECGQTARANGWANADLLPGVLVNSGANIRFVELAQEGFVQLHP